MIKKLLLLMVSSGIVLFLAGCSTIEVGKKFNNQAVDQEGTKPIAVVNADNFGYYLFNCLPLVTGDPAHVQEYMTLTDGVTLEKVTKMATKQAKELGATKVIVLNSKSNETTMLAIFTFGIFWYKDIQVSCIAIK